MKPRWLHIVLFLLLGNALPAQTVLTGTVKDTDGNGQRRSLQPFGQRRSRQPRCGHLVAFFREADQAHRQPQPNGGFYASRRGAGTERRHRARPQHRAERRHLDIHRRLFRAETRQEHRGRAEADARHRGGRRRQNHLPRPAHTEVLPSINIKLAKDVALTGTAKVGLGVWPFLWKVNTTPMLFSGKVQMLAAYRTNNTGDDLSMYTRMLTFENYNSNRPAKLGEELGIKQAATPLFNANRYLDNQTHLGNLNTLFPMPTPSKSTTASATTGFSARLRSTATTRLITWTTSSTSPPRGTRLSAST